MESDSFSFSTFLLALGFFVYGVKLTSEHLRNLFSDQMRVAMKAATANPLVGFSCGFLGALLFQSSIAIRGLIVGFATVGFLTLEQAIPILLGSDLAISGLTFVFAVVSRFDLLPFSQGLLIFGIVGNILFRKNFKSHARIMLSLGFLLYGLALMNFANAPLRDSATFQVFLRNLLGQPFWAFTIGVLLTSFLQSSLIVIGALIVTSYSGLIPFVETIPLVLGVNLGSAIATFLAAANSQDEGRHVAHTSLLIKAIGTLVFFPIYPWYGRWIENFSNIPPYQIAWSHIIFNGVLALVFLPLAKPFARFVRKTFPPSAKEKKFASQFLDTSSLDSPTIALANVTREISRMASIVEEMLRSALQAFESLDREIMMKMDELDDQVDQLDREIKFYLSKIQHDGLTNGQSKKAVDLLIFTNNLETIGDIINRNLMVLAEKKRKSAISFPKDAWAEILDFHEKVLENYRLALAAFVTSDVDLGKKVLRNKKFLGSLEQELDRINLDRVRQTKGKDPIEPFSIYLDILGNLRLVNSTICKMAYPAVDRRRDRSDD